MVLVDTCGGQLREMSKRPGYLVRRKKSSVSRIWPIWRHSAVSYRLARSNAPLSRFARRKKQRAISVLLASEVSSALVRIVPRDIADRGVALIIAVL